MRAKLSLDSPGIFSVNSNFACDLKNSAGNP